MWTSCAVAGTATASLLWLLALPLAAVAQNPPDIETPTTKYFFEPGSNDTMGHYDVRFFKGVVTYEQREETLHHMIRAYLDFFRKHHIETWIAHGTLLGWWWNGKILPWDWDLDVQVSGVTLEFLGKNFNQTYHSYLSEDGKVKREYLLDINPHSAERVRGDGMNVIDARWIDTSSGQFIDITGISETEPDMRPGELECKNLHRYKTTMIYPMRESVFEGVPALIPYAYDQILVEEYHDAALAQTEFHNHTWSTIRKEWIPVKGADSESKFPLASGTAAADGLRKSFRKLKRRSLFRALLGS